jgi:hypothetical protein
VKYFSFLAAVNFRQGHNHLKEDLPDTLLLGKS